MASSPQGARLTEEHRRAQVANQQRFLAEYLTMWSLLDPRRLADTAPGWLRAVMQLLGSYRQESADLADSYYRQVRLVEAPEAEEPPPRIEFRRPVVVAPREWGERRAHRGNRGQVAEPRPRRQSGLVVNWGADEKAARTSLIVTGPVNIKAKTSRGQGLQIINRSALVESAGAASRHVLNGGRRTLLTAIDGDQQAIGWQRVGDGSPCAFCAMLISRGPVYGSAARAGFQAHDHCACTAEPVFSRDAEWAPNARDFRKLWYSATRGYSGKDALNAFRRAYDAQQRETATEAA